ncbi:MAG: hypothetical protein QM778_27750 [Myxococcales bacterium]
MDDEPQPTSDAGRDAGHHASGSGDASTDAATPEDYPPLVDCGFKDWSTPFTWTPTSVTLKSYTTAPNDAYESYIGSPDVHDNGAVWDMFYAMSDAKGVGRIGHATSQDRGVTWKRDAVRMDPYGNTYASAFLDTPSALYEGGALSLYVFANSMLKTPGGRIGYSVRKDEAWTYPFADAVLSAGAETAWDGLWVESPEVKRIGKSYFMWFTGIDSQWIVGHGVATSEDGVHWKKHEQNPVVRASDDPARFDSFLPGGTSVVQTPSGAFLMFYACGSRYQAAFPPLVGNLCLSISAPGDGKTFHKYPSDAAPTPMIPSSYFAGLNQDGVTIINGPINPSVIADREQGVLKIYYENQSSFLGLLTLPICKGM